MTTYQDVMQAIHGDVDAAEVEAMIADDKAQLTDAQMADLRAELAARDEDAAHVTKYRIVTTTGPGLPVTVDVDGYDTREAAHAMCADYDGEYRIEEYEEVR